MCGIKHANIYGSYKSNGKQTLLLVGWGGGANGHFVSSNPCGEVRKNGSVSCEMLFNPVCCTAFNTQTTKTHKQVERKQILAHKRIMNMLEK